MKKLFYSLAAIAALFATACTTDASSDVQMAGESKVTFSLQAKGLGSRAINDGTKATELTYAIYDGDWDLLDTKELSFSAGSLEMQLTLDLVKNQTYNFVFWAQSENAGCYTLNLPQKGEPSVDVDYSALASNNDDLDAFYGKVLGLEVKGTVNKTVELRRPFAQINFGTDDLERAAQLGFDLANAKVSVTTKTYNKFYLNDGRVDGAMQDVTFTDATPIDTTADAKSLKAGDSNYHWVSMNYILWPDATDLSLSTCEMEIKVEGREPVKIEVPGAPARRNWRTNLVGSLLTDKSNIKVVIKPEFEGEQTNTNGYYIVNDVYHITNVDGLKWLADQVNSGATTFAGKTVVLDGDIDLTGFTRAAGVWTPIGNSAADRYTKYFGGTFDGSGYTISNFSVDCPEGAGLFGYMHGGTIKNLTVKNVTLKGSHYAGGIVAWAESSASKIVVDNCHVDGLNVVLDPNVLDANNEYNGDKIGGIVGYAYSGKFTNCSVKNATMKGYRDIGGIAGFASYSTIDGCEVEDLTLVQDLSNDYKAAEPNGKTPTTLGVYVGSNGADNSGSNIENAAGAEDVVIAKEATSQEALDSAVASNATIMLASGEYKLNSCPAGLTLIGSGSENTVVDVKNQRFGVQGDVAVENATVVFANEDYFGFQHTDEVYFKDCVIEGQPFLYGNVVTFDNCTFKQTDSNKYNVWTYDARNLTFNNCVFNSAGKSVLIYKENGDNITRSVVFNNCELNASTPVEGKAAVEIDSSFPYGGAGAYDVVLNKTTATGFANGNVSGNSLWNQKKGTNATVTVDGELKCVAGFGMITEGYYAQGSTYTVLDGQGFLKVATTVLADSSKNVTVELANDINLAGIEWPAVKTNAAFVLDGKGHTISNLTTSAIESNGFNCVGMFTSTRKATTIKNLVVENATVTGNGLDNSHGAVLVSTTWSTLNISGVTVKGSTVSNCDRSSVLATYLYWEDAVVDNCKVEGCTLNSIGTAGAILGVNNSNNFTMTNCQVNGTTISSSEGNNKAGLFIGTWQDAGTLTESGNTHTNSKAINAGTETNNEIGRHA